jgi:hypothetical protein
MIKFATFGAGFFPWLIEIERLLETGTMTLRCSSPDASTRRRGGLSALCVVSAHTGVLSLKKPTNTHTRECQGCNLSERRDRERVSS